MFRVNNKFISQIFLTLLYWRDQWDEKPQSGERIRDSASRGWASADARSDNVQHHPGWHSTVLNVFDIMGGDDFDFDSHKLLDELSTQINQKVNSRGDHDGDLIDTMVKILKSPRGLNILSGKNLDQLRKAILLPEELAGLKTKLSKNELSCGSCGRELKSGDMLTMTRDMSGVAVISCTICSIPRFIPCPNKCENHIELSPSLRKSIQRTTETKCQTCAEKKKSKLAEPAVSVSEPDIDETTSDELELDGEDDDQQDDEYLDEGDEDNSPFTLDEEAEVIQSGGPGSITAGVPTLSNLAVVSQSSSPNGPSAWNNTITISSIPTPGRAGGMTASGRIITQSEPPTMPSYRDWVASRAEPPTPPPQTLSADQINRAQELIRRAQSRARPAADPPSLRFVQWDRETLSGGSNEPR